MRAFCDRYPDTKLIDVVNEPPPHTTPAYIDGIGGAGASGYDWIVNAFKWARECCPNAILILNDYNTIEYGNDNTHFIDIVNKIKAAGAPIDAIGAQAHAAYKHPDQHREGVHRQARAPPACPSTSPSTTSASPTTTSRSTIMQEQMTMFWNDDDIKGITLWGYIVGATWRATPA